MKSLNDTIPTRNKGRWSIAEHDAFITSFKRYGENWEKIAGMLNSRSKAQIRSHAQKYFIKLKLMRNPFLNSLSILPSRTAVSETKMLDITFSPMYESEIDFEDVDNYLSLF